MTKQNTNKSGPMMLAIFLSSFLAFIGTSTMNIALPALMEQFNSNLRTINWTLTGFMLAAGVVAPVTGFLGRKFSNQRVCFHALLGFTLSSLLCAGAWNSETLILFRILQGIFSGLIAPVTMTIIYENIASEKHALAISLWSLAAMLSPAVGPTLSGWLIGLSSWRFVFLFNIPLGIVTAVLIKFHVPYYTVGESKRFDIIGFTTGILASLALLIAFSSSSKWGWASPRTLGLIVFGLILLALFTIQELRCPHPLLNLRIFKYTRFTISVIITSIITISLYAGSLLTPLFLQNVQQMSPLKAGLVLLPASLITALVMPLVGLAYNRTGPRTLILSGAILIALGSWKMGELTPVTSEGYSILWMTIRSLGISLSIIPATNAGMEILPREESSHASSLNNWIRQALASLSLSIFASMLTILISRYAQAGRDISHSFTEAVNSIYKISAVIVMIAVPLGFILKKKASEIKEEKNKLIS